MENRYVFKVVVLKIIMDPSICGEFHSLEDDAREKGK